MELRLVKLIIVGTIIFIFSFCSDKEMVDGNWGTIDSGGDYAEFYFSSGKIRIYHEIAGELSTQSYIIKNDSLLTNILKYKIDQVTPDSLVLTADSVTMYLKRIKTGFRLSDFNNEKESDIYTTDFYNRMKARKRNYPQNITNTNKMFEEQAIELNKPKDKN